MMNQSKALYHLHCAVKHAKRASSWARFLVAKAINAYRRKAAAFRALLRAGWSGFPAFAERDQAWITRADLHLSVLDPSAERPSLRDRVPLKPETLATRARKYLTLGAEYAERVTFAKRRNGPFPANVYPAWCRYSQSPCKPFESGRNVLPGMESFAEGIA